jgi:hypothetical protein
MALSCNLTFFLFFINFITDYGRWGDERAYTTGLKTLLKLIWWELENGLHELELFLQGSEWAYMVFISLTEAALQ